MVLCVVLVVLLASCSAVVLQPLLVFWDRGGLDVVVAGSLVLAVGRCRWPSIVVETLCACLPVSLLPFDVSGPLVVVQVRLELVR